MYVNFTVEEIQEKFYAGKVNAFQVEKEFIKSCLDIFKIPLK